MNLLVNFSINTSYKQPTLLNFRPSSWNFGESGRDEKNGFHIRNQHEKTIRMMLSSSCVLRKFLRLNEVREFYLSVYGNRLRLRPGTARPGPTANRSRFCEANNFFISALNELKLRI